MPSRRRPAETLLELGANVYFCRVCQFPIIEPMPSAAANLRIIEYGGRRHSLCSKWCERMFLTEPERYGGQNLFEVFDGWELSEVVKAGRALRSDEHTLLAQPHLSDERMWTIDDLKACNLVIRDPLTAGVFL